MVNKTTYYTAWDLSLDGEIIAPGVAIEVDPVVAADLLKSGVLLDYDPATVAQDAADGVAHTTALEAKVTELEKQLNVANNKLAQGNKAELTDKITALEAKLAAR